VVAELRLVRSSAAFVLATATTKNDNGDVVKRATTLIIAAIALLNGVVSLTATACTVTSPSCGLTVLTPPADFQIILSDPVDPSSVQASDLTVNGISADAALLSNSNTTIDFIFNTSPAVPGVNTIHISAGAFDCGPPVDFNCTFFLEPCPQFTVISSTGTIEPGITDTGNHTDDGDTFITLPFPVQFYDQIFNGVNVSSNGRIDFACVNEPLGNQTQCLPASPNQCPYDYTMFLLWQNLRTDFGLSGCASFPSGTCGIFTSVLGSPPNRIFNIEWRTVLFANNASTQNFEVRFYESDPVGFDVIYGAINSTGADQNFVAGIQGPNGCFTEDFCANPAPVQNVVHNYVGQTGTPTPTPTATPSPRSKPTPRPRPSPRPRP
jgi:hypothetical protein